MSVWETVSAALKSNGIAIFPPATHSGECTSEYAVLKYDGGSHVNNLSTESHYYSLLCYVPRKKYTDIFAFVDKCKNIMKADPIYPMLKPTGQQTPDFYDDTAKAYMISIQYINYARNEQI